MVAMQEQIAVIGAGVSGLTCAVLLAERGYHTRILAEEIGARTTSAAAAAIWFPYDAEPAGAVVAWSLETFGVLQNLSRTPGCGVSMIELRQCARAGEIEIPAWAISLGARRLTPSAVPPAFTSGFAVDVPLTDTTIYLDYLLNRFHRAGGETRSRMRLAELEEVGEDYSTVINCTGVGAATLVPDREVEPHRGQVVIVPRLAQAHALVCDDPPLMYVIPRTRDCVLGGTNERSFNRAPDPNASASIIAECRRVLECELPPISEVRVGLRPFRRGGNCLRAERLHDGRRVVHNYGHGGSGFTLSWGCARAAVGLATAI